VYSALVLQHIAFLGKSFQANVAISLMELSMLLHFFFRREPFRFANGALMHLVFFA
jgi:hypothetical protein